VFGLLRVVSTLECTLGSLLVLGGDDIAAAAAAAAADDDVDGDMVPVMGRLFI